MIDLSIAPRQLRGVCNLYKMDKSAAEVARWFEAVEHGSSNAGEEVYPGYPGLVVESGEVRSMTWGFPLVLKGKNGQPLKPKPVNNTRTDKLDSGFWRPSFVSRRCLVPVTSFAEAEGPKGGKTRTWFRLPNDPIFAVAGIWRDTAEWGPAYSIVMTEACVHVAGVHDRMPVIVERVDWAKWLSAPPEDAVSLCVPYAGPMVIDRTIEPWARR